MTLLTAIWAGWTTFQIIPSGRYVFLMKDLKPEPSVSKNHKKFIGHNFTTLAEDVANFSNGPTNLSVVNVVKSANLTWETNPTSHRLKDDAVNSTRIQEAKKCLYLMKNIKPTPGPSPLTALASFPRSGNAYTRLLIQIATQFETSSVYWKTERFKPIKKDFPGVSQSFFKARGICTKTHKHDDKHMAFFSGGAILIVRDPHKSIISHFVRMFRKSGGTKKALELIQANDTQWIEISSKLAAEWRDLYKDWLNTASRVLVIPYERLCENTIEELEKIVTFLHQPIKVDQLQCAVSLYPCQCRDRTEFQPHYPEELPGYISEINNTLLTQFSTSLPSYGTKCPVI